LIGPKPKKNLLLDELSMLKTFLKGVSKENSDVLRGIKSEV